MRSGMRSATPVTTMPPYECPASTTSYKRSHRNTPSTSSMWVVRLIAPLKRCARSPCPVSVGVNTVWPRARSSAATRAQHQPPLHAPCTRTKVADIASPVGEDDLRQKALQTAGPSSRYGCDAACRGGRLKAAHTPPTSGASKDAASRLLERQMNYFRTAMLLAGLTALFMGVGYLIGGPTGALIAFVIAAGMNLFSYWNSDRMVLSMHGAQEVDARTAPDLHRLVQDLAGRAQLPMPRVYLMDNPQPNAFATGRDPDHAAVAVTTGLMNALSREEVAGVVAHELAHIKNRDTLIMTITATIAGAISMLAQFGMFFTGNRDNNSGGMGIIGTLAMVILAPIAAMIVQMAISRTRGHADRKS